MVTADAGDDCIPRPRRQMQLNYISVLEDDGRTDGRKTMEDDYEGLLHIVIHVTHSRMNHCAYSVLFNAHTHTRKHTRKHNQSVYSCVKRQPVSFLSL